MFCTISTDFYVETGSEQKLGFPPGVAEKLVLSTMYKWKNTMLSLQKTTLSDDSTNSSDMQDQIVLTQSESLTPPVVQEVEIDSCNKSNIIKPSSAQSPKTDRTSDSYNGAVRENYVWTQTLSDLDVLVKIPEHIKASKDTIKVDISSSEIKIDGKPAPSSADSEWDSILDGKLSFKIRSGESTWSIEGKQINVRSFIWDTTSTFGMSPNVFDFYLFIQFIHSLLIDSSWKGFGKVVGSLNSWWTKNWFEQDRLFKTFWWYGARGTNESARIDVELSTEGFRQTDVWTNCNYIYTLF